MNMRPFVLDAGARASVEKVMTYACENVLEAGELSRRSRGMIHMSDGRLEKVDAREIRPTNDEQNSCVLPVGYQIYFTVEEQPPPFGWVRHFSVSVLPHQEGQFANPAIVFAIIKLFGFREGPGNPTYIENNIAVNILEPLKDDEDPRCLHLAQPWRIGL